MNAEDLVLNFKKDMANLSKTERRRAIESVRDVIRAAAFDDTADSAYEVEYCPRCGSTAVVKKGKAGNGEQRYLCRGCGRTFGMGSERILGTSKLPKETWMAYAECFVLMLPLRECARRCRVCLKTAYTMRHRLIECLSAYSPSFRVERGCGCELDETYFPEPFKGNHAKGSFTMPRPSRHRGRQVHGRGLSRERICAMTGVNDSNETFLEVTGRGALSRERAMDALRGRIATGSVVATDRAAAHVGVLALAQRLVRQDLGRAADDGRLGVDVRVARDHTHVLASQHLHEIEELLADQRLDGRRVVRAPPRCQRHELHPQRHQRLSRPRGRS